MSKTRLTNVLRALFGGLFVATSVGKLLDNRGFAEVLRNYRLFPEPALLALALAISLGELYLGYRLLRGGRIGKPAVVTAMIHGTYLALALVTLARGIELTNCGCFGVFLARPLTIWTPVEDGVVFALSLGLVAMTRSMG